MLAPQIVSSFARRIVTVDVHPADTDKRTLRGGDPYVRRLRCPREPIIISLPDPAVTVATLAVASSFFACRARQRDRAQILWQRRHRKPSQKLFACSNVDARGVVARGNIALAAKALEATEFASLVGRSVADSLDGPLSVTQLFPKSPTYPDTIEVRVGKWSAVNADDSQRSDPHSEWRRFWGDKRFESRTDAWHEDVFWRMARGHNCMVFAAKVAHAWYALRKQFGGAFSVQHRGLPVERAFLMQGHVRCKDLITEMPEVYLETCSEEAFPTFSTIGWQHRLAVEKPDAARKLGIDVDRQKRVLARGARLCEFLGEDPSDVCGHVWVALATRTHWLHIDLCGIAYGYQCRSSEGWPVHCFETPAYELKPAPPGQWGPGQSAVHFSGDGHLEAMQRDAATHRHFGFVFRGAGYDEDERVDMLEAEAIETWLAKAPARWLSDAFAKSVVSEFEKL